MVTIPVRRGGSNNSEQKLIGHVRYFGYVYGMRYPLLTGKPYQYGLPLTSKLTGYV